MFNSTGENPLSSPLHQDGQPASAALVLCFSHLMSSEQLIALARGQGERWRDRVRRRAEAAHFRLTGRLELFERDGVCAAFNGSNLRVVYFSQSLSQLLERLDGFCDMGDFQRIHDQIAVRVLPQIEEEAGLQLPQLWMLLLELLDNGFLREEDVDHPFPEHLRSQHNRFTSIIIMPTLDCNYRCDYCYHREIPPETKTASVLTIDQVRRALDCLMANTSVPPEAPRSLRFTGGEPTLHYQLVSDSLDYAAEIHRRTPGMAPFRSSMVTNCSLLDDRWIELITQHDLAIAVSLDGRQPRNDRRRKSLEDSAYRRTAAGLRRLGEAGIKPAILMTVSASNIDHLAEDVAWLYEHFELGGFSFNLDTSWNARYRLSPARYVAGVIRAYDELSTKGIADAKTIKLYKRFQAKEITISGCGAVFAHFVVLPDGTIGPCPRQVDESERMKIDADQQPLNESPLFRRWASYSHTLNATCHECSFLSICEGWCPEVSLDVVGHRSEPNDYTCLYTKSLLEWLIWIDLQRALGRVVEGQE